MTTYMPVDPGEAADLLALQRDTPIGSIADGWSLDEQRCVIPQLPMILHT